MIRQVCLFCNMHLGILEEEKADFEHVSHGVCPECFPRFVAGSGIQFADFLDSLPIPVLVFGSDGRAICANTPGRLLAAKEPGELLDRPLGEVFECAYANNPGGCGETVHCKSCTIRQTVMETASTGRPGVRVPAYMDLGDQIEHKSIRFLISTELAGEVVLLRIEEAEPAP